MELSSDWDRGFFPRLFISLQVGPMAVRQTTISPGQRENYFLEVIKPDGRVQNN